MRIPKWLRSYFGGYVEDQAKKYVDEQAEKIKDIVDEPTPPIDPEPAVDPEPFPAVSPEPVIETEPTLEPPPVTEVEPAPTSQGKQWKLDQPQPLFAVPVHGENGYEGRFKFTVTGVGDTDPERAKILFLVEGRDSSGSGDAKINFHFFIKKNFSRFFSHHFTSLSNGQKVGIHAKQRDQRKDFIASNTYDFDCKWRGVNVELDIKENGAPFLRFDLQLTDSIGKLMEVKVGERAYGNHTTGRNIKVSSGLFEIGES